MTHVALIQADFNGGGSAVTDDYTTAQPTGTGCIITSGGFESSTGSRAVDVWNASSTADTDRRPTWNSANHYAQVQIGTDLNAFSPAVLARYSDSTDDGYQLDPDTWSGALALGEWSGGIYTLITTGAVAMIGVSDTLQLECEGDQIRGGVNGVGEISVTDSTHASGFPGISCDAQIGGNVGDNFEAGHIQTNAAVTRIVSNATPALRESMRRRHEFQRTMAATAAED